MTNTWKHFKVGAMICFAVSILTAVAYPQINEEILYWVGWTLAFLVGISLFEMWQRDKKKQKGISLQTIDSVHDVVMGLLGWLVMLGVSMVWNHRLWTALVN